MAQAKEVAIFELINATGGVDMFRQLKAEGGGEGKKVLIPKSVTMAIPSRCDYIDKDGAMVKLRYISSCTEIDFMKQIAKDSNWVTQFPANYKWKVKTDRAELKFVNNRLVATKAHLIQYLRAVAYNESVAEEAGDMMECHVRFREIFPEVEQKKDIMLGFFQGSAMVKIKELYLEKKGDRMDSILASLFGAHYSIPETLEDKAEALILCVNDADSKDARVFKMLDDTEIKDSIEITVSKAISRGVLSFSQKNNEVQINRGNSKEPKFDTLYTIDPNLSQEEKTTQVIARLSTAEGEITLESIRKQVADKAKVSEPAEDTAAISKIKEPAKPKAQ